MSKEFNFPAFLANFGRIVDNEIKALGGIEGARAAKQHFLLADENSFYTGIIYFGDIVTVEDILVSCYDFFERHKEIICNDQLYIENCEQFEQSTPDIDSIIAHEVELAECYVEEGIGYMVNLAPADDLNNKDVLIGESESHDLYEPTA